MGQEEAGGVSQPAPAEHCGKPWGAGASADPQSCWAERSQSRGKGKLALSQLGLAHWVSHAPSSLSTRSCSLFPAASVGLPLLQLSS